MLLFGEEFEYEIFVLDTYTMTHRESKVRIPDLGKCEVIISPRNDRKRELLVCRETEITFQLNYHRTHSEGIELGIKGSTRRTHSAHYGGYTEEVSNEPLTVEQTCSVSHGTNILALLSMEWKYKRVLEETKTE